jgi:catechol-2,3-dioxygenase
MGGTRRLMMNGKRDRTLDDVGNIVAFEHVNVKVPDQALATAFYVVGLGFTRDPYLMVGLDNMWINIGEQQFHLPTGEPQVVRGHIGVVVPDLDALQVRLARARDLLGGTAFAYATENGHVAVTCPWGNRLRCHAPGPEFRDRTLGLVYVEFPVERGAADGIARFYTEVVGARASAKDGTARVRVGPQQELIFRETTEPIAGYDGHHVAIYLADFSGPHAALQRQGLLTRDTAEHEYRFETIVDPATRQPLFVLEHEVRSSCHPMYRRPLVNRNPGQTQPAYMRGRDAFVPGLA